MSFLRSLAKYVVRDIVWLGAVGVCATSLGLASVFLYLNPQIPTTETYRHYRFETPLRIFTAAGALVAEFGNRLIPIDLWKTDARRPCGRERHGADEHAASTAYIGLYGTVPVRKADTAGRLGKQADGTTGMRQATSWSRAGRSRAGTGRAVRAGIPTRHRATRRSRASAVATRTPSRRRSPRGARRRRSLGLELRRRAPAGCRADRRPLPRRLLETPGVFDVAPCHESDVHPLHASSSLTTYVPYTCLDDPFDSIFWD